MVGKIFHHSTYRGGPTANALGYYQNQREEGSVDPNRDFPYDILDEASCMQTIAARTLNEIYREHMFQLALTFHAGMEVVGYEWGAPTWLNYYSPDDVAQCSPNRRTQFQIFGRR